MSNIVNYISIVTDLKEKILYSQSRAITTVNKELVLLYWEIGNTIVQNQSQQGWGAKIIDSLSSDLKKSFPNMKGFSVRNLKYMRQFAFSYPQKQIVQDLLAQLNWYQNLTIMQKIKDDNIRKWYASKTIENGWSQAILLHQIESGLYERSQSKKITNFNKTLVAPHSELVQETLKDPYVFDFLLLHEKAKEKDIEEELVKHITKFLLELGSGFAFAGKLNFYLSAVDDLVKSKDDNPTIGLILCKSKDKVEVEYSLRDINKPIGISEYQITKSIPNDLKSKLPTIQEIEEQLENEI